MSQPETFASANRRRLTKLEKKMLMRAAEFVLADEWPWGDDPNYTSEHAALERASEKLKDDLEKP